MELIKDLIFGGKLPFNRLWFRWVFQYILPVGLTLLLAVGYFAGTLDAVTEPLGNLSWNLLLLILFIGPVSKILPDLKILRTLGTLRKELGIGMFYLGLAHGASHLPVVLFYPLNALPTYVLFGGMALSITFLLYLTSNMWSMKFLKKYWKWLHRLIYVALLFIIGHIYFLDPAPEALIEGVVIIGGLILVKVLAARKFQIRSDYFKKSL